MPNLDPLDSLDPLDRLDQRLKSVIRPDVQSMHAYAIQPSRSEERRVGKECV